MHPDRVAKVQATYNHSNDAKCGIILLDTGDIGLSILGLQNKAAKGTVARPIESKPVVKKLKDNVDKCSQQILSQRCSQCRDAKKLRLVSVVSWCLCCMICS